MRNLLEVRSNNWEVVYDDETEEVAEDEEYINFMIAACQTVIMNQVSYPQLSAITIL